MCLPAIGTVSAGTSVTVAFPADAAATAGDWPTAGRRRRVHWEGPVTVAAAASSSPYRRVDGGVSGGGGGGACDGGGRCGDGDADPRHS